MSLLLALVLFIRTAAAQLHHGNFWLQDGPRYNSYEISPRNIYRKEPVYPGFYAQTSYRTINPNIFNDVPKHYSNSKLVLQPPNQYLTNEEKFSMQKLKNREPYEWHNLRRMYYPSHFSLQEPQLNARQAEHFRTRAGFSRPVILYPDLPDPLTNILQKYAQKGNMQNNQQPSYMGPPNMASQYIRPPNMPPQYIYSPNLPPQYIRPPNMPPQYIHSPNMLPQYIRRPNMPPQYILPPNMPPQYIRPPNMPPQYIHPQNIPPQFMRPPNMPPQYIRPPIIQPPYMPPPNTIPVNVLVPNPAQLNPYLPIVLYPDLQLYQPHFGPNHTPRAGSPYYTTLSALQQPTNAPNYNSPTASQDSTPYYPGFTQFTNGPYSSLKTSLTSIPSTVSSTITSKEPTSFNPYYFTASQPNYPATVNQPLPVSPFPGKTTYFSSHDSQLSNQSPSTAFEPNEYSYQTSFTPSKITGPYTEFYGTTIGQRITDLPAKVTTTTQSEDEMPLLRTSLTTASGSEDLSTPSKSLDVTPTKKLDSVLPDDNTSHTQSRDNIETTIIPNIKITTDTQILEGTTNNEQTSETTTTSAQQGITKSSITQSSVMMTNDNDGNTSTSINSESSPTLSMNQASTPSLINLESTTSSQSNFTSLDSQSISTASDIQSISTLTSRIEDTTLPAITLSSGVETSDNGVSKSTSPGLNSDIQVRMLDDEYSANSSESPSVSQVIDAAQKPDCNQNISKQSTRRETAKPKKKCRENHCKNTAENDIEEWLNKNFGRLMQKIADMKSQNTKQRLQVQNVQSTDKSDTSQIKDLNLDLARYSSRLDETYLGEGEFKRHAIYE